MAKIINIANKLNNEPSFIVLGEGKQYKVDDSYQAVLKATEYFDKKGLDNMLKGLEIILGKEAVGELKTMSVENILAVMTGITSLITGESYEETEARFQEEGKSEK